jgi:hypothetical protein
MKLGLAVCWFMLLSSIWEEMDTPSVAWERVRKCKKRKGIGERRWGQRVGKRLKGKGMETNGDEWLVTSGERRGKSSECKNGGAGGHGVEKSRPMIS